MQRTYFLGGAAPEGFQTAFWEEQRDCYGILLKGGPGTGKSTLMKAIAAAFAGEHISLYHCASDPRSLDAVVLEERRVYIADATAPHTSDTPLPCVSGELCDLGAGLDAAGIAAHAGEIRALYTENQQTHAAVRKGLSGISAMEALVTDTATRALRTEKLTAYTARLCKRLLPRKAETCGVTLHRQCCAITPEGRLTLAPAQFETLILLDPYMTAAPHLLRQLAGCAAEAGLRTELTRSQTQPEKPITHVILPALALCIFAVQKLPAGLPEGCTVLQMRRFYDADLLRRQRTLLRFCAKTAEALEAESIALLADALRTHDALEAYYIRALNRPFLDQTAARLIEKIRTNPRFAPRESA